MADSTPTYGQAVWTAVDYDAPRRRLVPSFDLLYDTAAGLVAGATTGDDRPAVLNLGAGTGLLSAAVVARVPAARLHLFDGSADMLDGARRRFADRPGTTFTQGDLTGPLPPGPFAAVVSALAIHHLDDPAKRDLFRRVHAALRPGGTFVNLDQVLGPTPAAERQYAAAHEAHARRHGATDAEWAAAVDRMGVDRPATLAVQWEAMQLAGFDDVDCVAKDGRFAVFVGRRPAAAT